MVKGLTKEHGVTGGPSLFLKPGKKDPRLGNKVNETNGASALPQLTRAKKPCKQCEAKHGPKWTSCTHDVIKKQGGETPYNPYAVCTTSVGSQKENKKAKEKNKKESARVLAPKEEAHPGKFHFTGRFREVSADIAGKKGKKFRVTLLREGLGNFHDAFYYTAEAIQSAVPIFEGAQFFIDHPDIIEEKIHPERSVRDLGGYFENVALETSPDGVAQLAGDLVFVDDPSLALFRNQIKESIGYSQKHGKDLVGLSINADGDFADASIIEYMASDSVPEPCKQKLIEALKKDITQIHPVTVIKSAVSCDLVTKAGAGGKINTLLEKEKSQMGKKLAHEEEEGKAHEEHEEEHHEEEGHKEEEEGMHEESEEEEEDSDSSDGADGDSDGDGDGDGDASPDGDHEDEEQDAKLIKKMLDQYLGAGDHSEEAHQKMRQHMKQAKTMGLKDKEAMKCAGYSMKMAKHMEEIKKMAGVKDGDGADGADGADDGADAHQESDADSDVALKVKGKKDPGTADQKGPMDKKKQVQESARGKVSMTEVLARLARTENELSKMKLKEATESVLRKSGLPMAATRKFRESILPTIKTENQLMVEVKKFKEAYHLGSESSSDGFILSAERGGVTGDSEISFADCKEE